MLQTRLLTLAEGGLVLLLLILGVTFLGSVVGGILSFWTCIGSTLVPGSLLIMMGLMARLLILLFGLLALS